MRIINFLFTGAVATTLLLFMYGTRGGGLPFLQSPAETAQTPVQPQQSVATAQAGTAKAGGEQTVPPMDSSGAEPVLPSASEPAAPAAPERNPWTASQQATTHLPVATAPSEAIKASVAAAAPVVAPPDPTPLAAAAPDPSSAKPKITKTSVAKYLFSAVKQPANLASRSIGFYSHGCLAGGQPLPVNGPAWQVMRLSRNRNWGHPTLIKYIERFAEDAKEKDGWPGLLVGDLSMPRGGPMPFGHASHQVGLDVDIWYEPEPDHELTAEEREDKKMRSFLLDPGHVNPAVWKPEYEKLLRRAVSYPEVARVFVNPAIKKWLCDNAKGDRSFLRKITPIMGHDDHFHVRLVCPADNPGCENQVLKATDEGCGKGLDHWVESLAKEKLAAAAASSAQAATLSKAHLPYHGLAARIQLWQRQAAALRSKRNLTMAQLPAECETVLKASPAPVASNAVNPQAQTR